MTHFDERAGGFGGRKMGFPTASRRSQRPLALAATVLRVPLSRFTPQVGGGPAFCVGHEITFMKRTIALLSILMASVFVQAGELRVSATEPIFVVAPDLWQSAKDRPPVSSFPFDTYRLVPPSGRNAQCLVSIFDKNRSEFADTQFLRKLLRADCLPYVNSPDELSKIEIKVLNIKGGLGYYANFVDPDLVGKPIVKDSFKTATPVILSLGTNYLIKVTIFCDQINGPDYRDSINIVESIKAK